MVAPSHGQQRASTKAYHPSDATKNSLPLRTFAIPATNFFSPIEMPKAIAASESESDADVIPSKAAANAAADEDHEMADAQDEGTAEEDDEMAPEEYVVEAIEKHRWVDKVMPVCVCSQWRWLMRRVGALPVCKVEGL